MLNREEFRALRKKRAVTPTHSNGRRFQRDGIATYQDKPPKMRFRVGQFFKRLSHGDLWEIIFAYRLASDPHEWIYVVEERKTIESPRSLIALYCEMWSALQNGPLPERIQFRMFRTFQDAVRYWGDYYAYGSHIHEPNQHMIHEYEKVSDGEIIKNGQLRLM